MNNKFGGIYSITSKINGKRYVGSSVNISRRWWTHLNDLKKNKHHSQHLQNHYNKYGANDLVFTILETVEQEGLMSKDYKFKLINIEQTYLDNWAYCEFNNCRKVHTVGDVHGYKKKEAKYYTYHKDIGKYGTFYIVDKVFINFKFHLTEADAAKEVAYIKTLNNQQLLDYKEQCKIKPKVLRDKSKYYYYSKKSNKWSVIFPIDNSRILFGSYTTEEDAKNIAAYLKPLTIDEKLEYKRSIKKLDNNIIKHTKPKRTPRKSTTRTRQTLDLNIVEDPNIITFRTTSDLKTKWQQAAAAQGLSLTALIIVLLNKEVAGGR